VILQELYSVATRPLDPPLGRDDTRQVIAADAAWPVVVLDPALILAATRLEERHQLSLWDALIIEAARVAGAEGLLTEDLPRGQDFDGVVVENRFVPG
jgi:predicted nucleic acid-binding protein